MAAVWDKIKFWIAVWLFDVKDPSSILVRVWTVIFFPFFVLIYRLV